MIELKSIIELLAIMIGIKLILENWQPPLQKSYQALLMLAVGGFGGWFINPTKEGLITGLIGGTVAYWGRSIFAEIEEIKESSKGGK